MLHILLENQDTRERAACTKSGGDEGKGGNIPPLPFAWDLQIDGPRNPIKSLSSTDSK